jgi:hypothetical protein
MKFSTVLGLLALAVLSSTACTHASETSTEATEAQQTSDGGSPDGVPTRIPCTKNLGSGLAGTFGRLDGVIVAVEAPGHGGCFADRHHVHIQVLSQGQTYDVAVNTDSGFMAEKDVALPGGPWADGWHRGGSLDYTSDLGLHASDFVSGSEAVLDQKLEAELANANHVSIFATLYSHSGVHLVHRRGNNIDGAVVLNPLSPAAHVIAFHFADQSF